MDQTSKEKEITEDRDKSMTVNYLRLKEAVKEKGVSNKDLQDLFSLSASSIKSYLNGHRNISADYALKFAAKYNVSLDWLYGKDGPMDKSDSIGAVLLACARVFQIRIKRYPHDKNSTYPVLVVDERFHAFLLDFQEKMHIVNKKEGFSEQTYLSMCKDIYQNHKAVLGEIFTKEDFVESPNLEIDTFAVENLLSFFNP